MTECAEDFIEAKRKIDPDALCLPDVECMSTKAIEDFWRRVYIKIATEQKAIDDEEYRKDMCYVGVKREELIDKVLDATIQYLQDHLIDVVLVGEDKQSNAWGYRILDERIKYDVKQQINKILNE